MNGETRPNGPYGPGAIGRAEALAAGDPEWMNANASPALANYNLSINGVARDNLIALCNTLLPEAVASEDWDTLSTLEWLAITLEEASLGPAVNNVTALDLADTLRDAADAVDDAHGLESTTYYRMAEDAIEVMKNGL